MRLRSYDVDRALKILPEQVKALLTANGKALVVAGGFFRSIILHERVKDIDLFSSTPEAAKLWAKELNENYSSSVPIISTQNAYSIKNINGHFVQFIHRWTYPSPEKLIDSFDFTISCAALWFDRETNTWDSVVDENFYADCAAKRLVFRNPERIEEPAGSMLRVLKFSRKGYTIPSESLAGVINKLVKGSIQRGRETELGINISTDFYPSIYRSIKNMTGDS